MTLHKLVDHDLSHVPARGEQPVSEPHPYNASHRQPYGFSDGRRMDVTLDGVRWWSLIILKRWSDDQFSLARTPVELEQRQQAFILTDNTTAHQGLLKDRRLPPSPVEVLGAATGRRDTPEELARHFSPAVVPRTINRYGWVTLHGDHLSIEAHLPRVLHCGQQCDKQPIHDPFLAADRRPNARLEVED
jgi:hypothetical protein